jgi:hypothetical protein
MNKLIRRLLVYILILSPTLLIAQKNYSDKIVNFPAKHITLRAALKTLSDQTGCVFSYDPTRINDKQELTISSCNKLTLQATLQKILPKNIHFKFKGKYIVLKKPDFTKTMAIGTAPKNELSPNKTVNLTLKTEGKVSEMTMNNSVSEPKDNSGKLHIDSINQNEETIQRNPASDNLVKADSVHTPATIKPDLQPIACNSSDTPKVIKQKPKPIFEMEMAANNHLAAFSTHIGLNNIYSIISIGTDYYKSQHFGVGAGVNIKLYKHFGANIDLIQYTLVSGRSAKVKVRTATTQISSSLNYSIGNRLKIFAGPSVYRISSKYVREGSNTDLGKLIEYSVILGIKVDLIKR